MFSKNTYIQRRNRLKRQLGSGLVILPGNEEAPYNYPANAYQFRQDSTFLYFFGQKQPGLVGVIDIDNNEEWLFGDDLSVEDIVWMGETPSAKDLASAVGVAHSDPRRELTTLVQRAKSMGRDILFAPPYRGETMIMLSDLLGIHPLALRDAASIPLIKAIVEQRSVKTEEEVKEIERAIEIGYAMHTTAQKLIVKPGMTEHRIAGVLEGIVHEQGSHVSFATILTMHGEIMHGVPTENTLQPGKLVLCDAGAETTEHYCSDHTRTTPVSGHYTSKQRDIYQIVVDAHDLVIQTARPGYKWLDMHLDVCRLITDRLKDLHLMKGNTQDAVEAGAHAMFFPTGLGHMMGMDVHDMEGLGQQYLGFDDEVRPSTQFGLSSLRCGRRLHEGFVMTDEPGIYFIPALIKDWKARRHCQEFINFDEVEKYLDFGGVRIEDDLLITANGCRLLGKNIIPYHIDDVEAFIHS